VYDLSLQFEKVDGRSAEGSSVWVLRESDAATAAHVGQRAQEHWDGTLSRNGRTIKLQGRRLTDPHGIIATGEYVLELQQGQGEAAQRLVGTCGGELVELELEPEPEPEPEPEAEAEENGRARREAWRAAQANSRAGLHRPDSAVSRSEIDVDLEPEPEPEPEPEAEPEAEPEPEPEPGPGPARAQSSLSGASVGSATRRGLDRIDAEKLAGGHDLLSAEARRRIDSFRSGYLRAVASRNRPGHADWEGWGARESKTAT
jgi:hypothetical protein